MTEFTNQAFVSYGENQVAVSNIVAGTLINPVSMAMHAGDHHYRTGEIIPIVITIRNRSSQTYEDMQVWDKRGQYTPAGAAENAEGKVFPTEYVNGSLQLYINGERQPGPQIRSAGYLLVMGLTIPPHSDIVLMYQMRVTAYAPVGGVDDRITSTAWIEGDGLLDTPTATETIYYDPSPLITVTKSVMPREVIRDQPMAYTFTIYNYGASVVNKEKPLILTDKFTPRLNITGVYVGHTALERNVGYTYDAMGNFATKPNVLSVPAATFTYNAKTHLYSVMPGMTIVTVNGTI